MLQVIENRSQPKSDDLKQSRVIKLRDKFIITILYNVGLRVSEVVNINKNDFNIDDRTVRVMGKGSKERIVLLNDEVIRAYNEYIKAFPIKNKNAPLIVNISNGKHNMNRLSVRAVQNIVKNASIKANINKSVSPQILRHAYATNLVRKGVNIRAVQILMGHSNLNTTQIYLNLSLEDIRKEFEKTMS